MVLLVEDDEVNQFVLKHTLHKMGVQVEIAKNGSEAISKIKNNTYHLVLY